MRKLTFILLCVFAFGCSRPVETNQSLRLVSLNIPETAAAGGEMAFEFHISGGGMPVLLLRNALGQTVIDGKRDAEEVIFRLPSSFKEKSGPCHWSLIYGDSTLASGVVHITPSEIEPRVETYLGPGNIMAGRTDHTILVAVPSDVYGNPLPDGTSLTLRKQVAGVLESEGLNTNSLFAWKRVYSEERATRGFLSVIAEGSHSKELTFDIHPAAPVDFEISYSRNHSYADGNQVITFSTSVLKDPYNNTVSDGTLVSFLITNSGGKILRAQGTTIHGIATARMLHPDRADQWIVRALVEGIATSPEIQVEFLPVMRSFSVKWNASTSHLDVGPVESFLKQFQPDGLRVILKVTDEQNIPVAELSGELSVGYARFDLGQLGLPSGKYGASVEIGGITKEIPFELKNEELE
ncbi:hypothetical protein SAMN06265375_10328 [Muriicola jejuensis]|uniref:Lipoprotein n=1 Tax=Muriicola jejuensis TaxID=504488 RepID=A0A6P0UG50_9FLAO|nr:hypothetical protein [Muriicola jejuensis]NER11602.1 hypothetical protein [Muriicola jejuensis]SMP19339.1 hypothetical protein SAMN06265375_10328 [Muriicola jejuensis]